MIEMGSKNALANLIKVEKWVCNKDANYNYYYIIIFINELCL